MSGNAVEIRNPLPLGEGRVRAEALTDSTSSPQAQGAPALTPIGSAPLASRSPRGEGPNSTQLTVNGGRGCAGNALSLCAGLLMLAGCAPLVNRVGPPQTLAEDPLRRQAQQFLAGIAERRPAAPVPGTMYGESVLVDYTESGSCLQLLVTYQGLDHSETWVVCPGGAPARSVPESRSLPAAGDFRAVRHAVVRGAWRYGEIRANYAAYEIVARLRGAAPEAGCERVESEVILDGETLDRASDTVCGAP